MKELKQNLRHNINLNKDKMPACLICNPIVSCAEGSICDECFKWLEKKE